MIGIYPACVNFCATKPQQKHVGKGIVQLVQGKYTNLNMNPKGQMDQEQQHPLLPLL